MRNAIPKAIAYSRNVHAIENHSFQAWLKQQIEKEDLIAWGQSEIVKQPISIAGLPSRLYGREKVRAWKWWSFLIP